MLRLSRQRLYNVRFLCEQTLELRYIIHAKSTEMIPTSSMFRAPQRLIVEPGLSDHEDLQKSKAVCLFQPISNAQIRCETIDAKAMDDSSKTSTCSLFMLKRTFMLLFEPPKL